MKFILQKLEVSSQTIDSFVATEYDTEDDVIFMVKKAQKEEISRGKAMADLKGQLINACTSSTKLPFRIVTALRSFIEPTSDKVKEYFKKLADIKKEKIDKEFVFFPDEHDDSLTQNNL